MAAQFCSCIAKKNRNKIINLKVLKMKNYELRNILLHYNGKEHFWLFLTSLLVDQILMKKLILIQISLSRQIVKMMRVSSNCSLIIICLGINESLPPPEYG